MNLLDMKMNFAMSVDWFLFVEIVLAMMLAEAASLFAPEMLHVAAAREFDDARRGGLRNLAWLLAGAGTAAAWLVFGAVPGCGAAVWMLLRLIFVTRRFGIGMKARPVLSFGLLRALPESLLLRGAYILPAGGLLAGLWYGMYSCTVMPCVMGLALYTLLRTYNTPRGAEAERFGARWVVAALVTGLCTALGFNGVFNGVYCLWASLWALLPVQRNGSAWLSALLVLVQAALGAAGAWFGAAPLAWAALIVVLPVILAQKNAVYAAYLPLRAWFIRRKAR